MNEAPVAKYLKETNINQIYNFCFSCEITKKKWKGIRDCYTRHNSKKTKSGSEATTGRGYIYAPYLSFLNSLSNTRPKAKLQKESQDSSPYSRRESVEDDKSEKLIKILTARMNKKEEKYPNYNFFMSLLDDFSAINSDLKMDAKMEIMGVIKKYVQMSKYTGQNSNYGLLLFILVILRLWIRLLIHHIH